MFHKTWHFWLFQESKLVLVPFYSPRCHCHTVMDVSKKRPQHHPWQMKVIRSVRFGPGVLRGDCAPWLLWTTLRCCVKTNLGPTQKLQKFYGFFLDKCGRHLLMCWKNGEENTEKNKLVDKLMSYAWWFEEKKTFFRRFADLSNAVWKVQEKPVSTSPMSCATPIPRKTEM